MTLEEKQKRGMMAASPCPPAEKRIRRATSRGRRKGREIFWLAAGEWHPVIVDGKPSARMACPGCGANGSLADHEIDAAGNVTPSVDCTECAYHETGVVLEGWR